MRVVIFGGPDREEQAAREVAIKAGCLTATAITNDGKPCHAGNAYNATGFSIDPKQTLGKDGDNLAKYEYILFECGGGACGYPIATRCDHHNPSDYGYGLPPELYWQASSLGQLFQALGLGGFAEAPKHLRMIAAGDHCPAAAYKGLCPGIDPGEFRAHRIAGLTTTSSKDVSDGINGVWFKAYWDNREDVEKQLAFAEALLRLEPESGLFKGMGIRDLRRFGAIANLPEAALSTGMAYLSAIPDTDRAGMPTGKLKLNLGGDNSPEAVTAVMAWLNSLSGASQPAYGVPARGFAGRVFEQRPTITAYIDCQEQIGYGKWPYEQIV